MSARREGLGLGRETSDARREVASHVSRLASNPLKRRIS